MPRRHFVLAASALCLALVAAAQAGAAERDAPAAGGDGVWHAGPDWAVEAAEDLTYENITIEASGNLTLEPGSSLHLLGVNVSFTGNGTGLRVLVGLGATLHLSNATLLATAPNMTLVAQTGTVSCFASVVSVQGGGGGDAAIQVTDGDLTADDCTLLGGSPVVLLAERSTVRAPRSQFLRVDLSPGPVRLQGRGDYEFDGTTFGTLLAGGGAAVTLYARVTFHLADPSGSPVAGRVNGTTAGPRFFFSPTDAGGTAGPLRVFWMQLDPAPDTLSTEDRLSSPVVATGVAPGVGGNTTRFVIGSATLDVSLRLDRPFDVGLLPPDVAGGQPADSGPRSFFVALESEHSVSVRVRNGQGQASAPLELRVLQYEADPQSWALHATSREAARLDVPALEPGGTVTLSFAHDFGPWGTHVERSGPCYHTDQYFSVLVFTLEVSQGADYGPWNDTVSVGVVAYHVEGDPELGCTNSPVTGAQIIAVAATGAVGGALLLGFYFSGTRVAQRAARREAKDASKRR